ncbi:hypothetical protein ACFWY9_38040 [Amycolatopsis sp. NPDC059027]
MVPLVRWDALYWGQPVRGRRFAVGTPHRPRNNSGNSAALGEW